MIPELSGDFLQWLCCCFYYIAKSGSVRKAAEILDKTPSTISYQLKCLENDLGTVLFDRYKKSLIITGDGKRLLDWAITIFETLQGMRSSAGTSDEHLQGKIVLGASLPVAVLAAPAITRFLADNPDVHVRVERQHHTAVVRGVRESHFDFGLTGLTVLPGEGDFDILLKARPLLVLRKSDASSLPPVPTEEDLQGLSYIVFDADDGDPSFGLHSRARRFQNRIAATINNYHLMLHLVRAGLGVGIVDELCFRAAAYGTAWSDVATCTLDHLLPNVLYGILVRKNKFLSPQARALMRVLREHFLRLAATPSTGWSRILGEA